MSTDEYVPDEAEWKALATTETTHLTDEEKEYLPRAWDEWITRVRRDEARKAVQRLRDHLADSRGYNLIGPEGLDHYIRREHPKESP